MVSRWSRQFTAGRQHLHDEERIITDDLVELVRERIGNRHFTVIQLSSHVPLLVVQNYNGAPVVQKIVRQVASKAADTRAQSKERGVSSDISAAVGLP